MHDSPSPKRQTSHGTFASYSIGFMLSVMLTMVAYVLVVNHVLTGIYLTLAIVGLAILQLFVQLYFFLHLGREAKPRWNLMAFLFMAMVVIIVAFGSLWIMHNLDYHMMPQDMEQYMREHEGL